MGEGEGLSEKLKRGAGTVSRPTRESTVNYVTFGFSVQGYHFLLIHRRLSMVATHANESPLRGRDLPPARATSFAFMAGRTSGAPEARRIFFV
jgi:hypothetical protein